MKTKELKGSLSSRSKEAPSFQQQEEKETEEEEDLLMMEAEELEDEEDEDEDMVVDQQVSLDADALDESMVSVRVQKDEVIKKLSRAMSYEAFSLWIIAEWVISDMDRAILDHWQQVEWNQRYVKANRNDDLGDETSLVRLARKSKKCRRFSKQFIREEAMFWEQLRELYRYLQFSQGQWPPKELLDVNLEKYIPSDIPNPLIVNQKVTSMILGWIFDRMRYVFIFFVLAIYPSTEILTNGNRILSYELVTGTVIAVDSKNNRYKIQFDRREFGMAYVADTNLIGHGPELRIPCSKGGMPSARLTKKEEEETIVSQGSSIPEETVKPAKFDDSISKEEAYIQDPTILKSIVSDSIGKYCIIMIINKSVIFFYTYCRSIFYVD
jgi:hypothetical protein